MKILVTGGTGFIGSHTAAALSRRGHDVRVLIRSPGRFARIMDRLGATVADVALGDVTNAATVERALAGCEGVVHTAAVVSTSKRNQAQAFATNVDGTRQVIGQAAEQGLKHIVHVSSTAAIYHPEATALTGDEEPALAQTTYGRSKAFAEAFARDLQARGAPVVIAYPAAVAGPCDPGLSEPHEALQIFLQRFGIVTSTGLQVADVRDIATALGLMLEKLEAPHRLTIGGHYLPWRDLILRLEGLTGRRLLTLPLPGALLRAVGHLGNLMTALTGRTTPINTEGMRYATQWVRTDDSRARELLGVEFRDPDETLRDALISLTEAGQLRPKDIGALYRRTA